ncbi:odorant receptor 131-2-like [Lates calcarifer]|uniref:Odorant receptor 131-2-like n=1 Tax=Lates calcarifer TaxID=8187 RepID=A0AAJ8DT71_LATCA|nr:odorant receptor 131-2-like [Lates calcarifer]
MNSTGRLDGLNDAFSKHFITFGLGVIINCINGAFVYTYCKSEVLYRDPRYVLYIHLVINDMIMLTLSVALHFFTYTIPLTFAPCCILLLILVATTKNSPLNLAGMAVERYIAVCRPLHHAQICTVQRAYALIALIWVVSLIPGLTDIMVVLDTQPLSVFSRIVICYPTYLYNTPYHKAQSVAVQVKFYWRLATTTWCIAATNWYRALLFSFVVLTLIITYLKVLCAAQAASGSDQASARNARNTILLHGVQLLICTLSFISPLINTISLSIWPQGRRFILFTTYLLTELIPRLLSPLIYGVRDKKFSSLIRLHVFFKYSNSIENKMNLVAPWRRSKQVLQ